MRNHCFVGFIAAALSVSISTEAAAQSVPPPVSRPEYDSTKSAAYKWEVAYLTLSAIDAAETIDCLNRHVCSEGNPIFGHHPSTGKIILAKVGLGLIHFTVFKVIADRDSKTALRAAQISTFVQGGVVLLNAHLTFR